MARYHHPNPLDTLLYAADESWRLCGLPGADLHGMLELGGPVDVGGLRRAVAALHWLYPATQSRLAPTMINGYPRRRLDVEPADLEQVVREIGRAHV